MLLVLLLPQANPRLITTVVILPVEGSKSLTHTTALLTIIVIVA